MDTSAVACEGLCKRFRETAALDGLDLAVRPDSGHALVAGFDVVRQASQVRARIGLAGQNAAVDEILSGRQNLVMFGRLCHLPVSTARRRADELLAQFALTEAADKPVRQYSGGMRRRLDLAASFIVVPRVLFLDEPTTGLDPHGRNEVWQTIRTLAGRGTTVLLTTQYLDEADQLADAIAVIDAGRVIAEGTPDELKSLARGDRIDVILRAAEDLIPAARLLQARLRTDVRLDRDSRKLSAPVTGRLAALTEIIRSLQEEGITAEDIAVRRPTLDEAFLYLTGQQSPAGGITAPPSSAPR